MTSPSASPSSASNDKVFNPAPGKNKHIGHSFYFAYQGLKYVIKRERNFRLQVVMSIIAVSLGAWLNISPNEWLVILILIGFVLFAECLNSSVEYIVDLLVEKQYNTNAKIIKDVMAAGVLIAAVMATACGVVIFLPKLLSLFGMA